MATHSSTLAWKIPRMREPGGLPSMGLHRVGHDWNDWSDLAAAAAAWHMMWSIFHVVICHWYIFLGDGLFWSLAPPFKIRWFVYWLLSFKSYLYILGKSDVSFANIFSHSVVFLLILLTVSFIELKLLILMKSSLSIISFVVCKKSSPCPRSSRFSPVIF